jgi:hypothetical protein
MIKCACSASLKWVVIRLLSNQMHASSNLASMRTKKVGTLVTSLYVSTLCHHYHLKVFKLCDGVRKFVRNTNSVSKLCRDHTPVWYFKRFFVLQINKSFIYPNNFLLILSKMTSSKIIIHHNLPALKMAATVMKPTSYKVHIYCNYDIVQKTEMDTLHWWTKNK